MKHSLIPKHHPASPLKLTDRERDVLSLVEFNLEIGAEAVAKRLHISASSVNYTLRRLIEKEVIQPRCFINTFKLRLHEVGLFFSLSEQSQRSRDQLIRRFVEDPSVTFFGSVLGDYQYTTVVLCRGLSEFSSIVARLTGDQGAIVSDKSVAPRLSMRRFARKYLNSKLASKRILAQLSAGSAYATDETDEKLISVLGNSPFVSLRDVARRTGLPLATADRRIKQLRAGGIIQGLFYDLNLATVGVRSYRLLVHVQGLSSAVRDKVVELCTNHLSAVYLVEAIGTWDFEIGIETTDPRAIAQFIEELYAATGNRINEIKVLTELEDFTCRYNPEKLRNGKSRV